MFSDDEQCGSFLVNHNVLYMLYPVSYTPNTLRFSHDYLSLFYISFHCTQKQTTCRLHISFHGCEQNIELIGDAYAAHAGFNEWAETNNIIVLYPYAKVSSSRPTNPNGLAFISA